MISYCEDAQDFFEHMRWKSLTGLLSFNTNTDGQRLH